MKNIKGYLWLFASMLICYSCELDNYDGPDSSISGGIYDVDTKELVPQDIVSGTIIEYIEDGYENPEIQSMVVQVDGTYRNDLMFANKYSIEPVRGNFVPVGSQEIKVKGHTVLNFTVQPYIRIKNAKIEKQGNKIVATFNLEQTTEDKVKKIGLYVHPEPAVGEFLRQVAVEKTLDAVTQADTLYTLEIDIDANSSTLKTGQSYYFRIGALVNVAEKKSNYIEAIRITI